MDSKTHTPIHKPQIVAKSPLARLMFRNPNNVFINIACPDLTKNGVCNVVNCIFKHPVSSERKRSESPQDRDTKRVKIDADSATPTKQEKKESPPETPKIKDVLFVVPKALNNGANIQRIDRIESAKKILKHLEKTNASPTPNKLAMNRELEIASSSKNEKDYREKVDKFLGIHSQQSPRNDPQHIVPLEVNPAPAMRPVRKKYIEHLVEAIKRTDPENKTPISTAIEEEFKIASTNSTTTYNIAVKRRLYAINHPERVKVATPVKISPAEYLHELRALCIPKEKLIKFGFIMETPEDIDGPKNERTCHRCKQEFKLSEVMTEVDCRYHSGKIIKNQLGTRIYSCCGGVLGETDTDPCANSNHHVFYWQGPQEMHHAQPFKHTKKLWGVRKGSLDAVGIDCEMGFTSLGFELLRITAIDFVSGEEVFDILVKPKGQVLDLNTRWSGIAEIKEEALMFENAIELLGEIVDSNTVMIGHGLENDMNTMRLIHENIVDTAVLYPKHKATPTFRYSLKQLAFECLGRNIQGGQHDSSEDSLAAIDVTKHFIAKDIALRARRRSA